PALLYIVPPFFFQAEDGIRDFHVTGVQTCALPISPTNSRFMTRTNLLLPPGHHSGTRWAFATVSKGTRTSPWDVFTTTCSSISPSKRPSHVREPLMGA